MRLLLIDGDDLLWRVAVTASAEAQLAANLRRRIEVMADKLRADRMVFALTGKGNWRKSLWPGYKAHRANRPKPPLLAATRAALLDGWETREAPELEADDILGLAATDPDYLDGGPSSEAVSGSATLRSLRAERAHQAAERVIVSRDKDLLTVPGLHGSPCGALRIIRAEEAERRHLELTLAGDASDGFKGCPGIGKVRAERVLAAAGEEPERRWRAVVACYQKAGLGPGEALLQARLARVLQVGDLDPSGKPILWRPPCID